MAITIGTRLSFPTKPIQVPTIPFEQLDQTLQSLEALAVTTDQLRDVPVQFIEHSAPDKALYNELLTKRKQIEQELVESAKSGDVDQYLSKLRNAQAEFVNLYKPGGPAYALTQRYNQYKEQLDKIQEKSEEYANPLYISYFKNQLDKQLEKENIYDPVLGRVTPISPVNFIKEVDISEKVNDYIKDFAKEQNIDITPFIRIDPKSGKQVVDPQFFQIVKTKGVDIKNLEQGIRNLLQSPDVQGALAIETWGVLNSMSEEEKEATRQAYIAKKRIENTSEANRLMDTLNALKRMKNGEEHVKNLGFSSIEDYEDFILRKVEEYNQPIDIAPENAVQEILKEKYVNQGILKKSGIEEDIQLVANRSYLEQVRAANNRRLFDQLKILYQDPKTGTLLSTSTVKRANVKSVLSQSLDAVNSARDVDRLLSSDDYLSDVYIVLSGSGTPMEKFDRLSTIHDIVQDIIREDGAISPAVLKQQLIFNGINVTDEELNDMSNLFSRGENLSKLLAIIDNIEPLRNNLKLSSQTLSQFVEKAKTDPAIRRKLLKASGKEVTLGGFGVGASFESIQQHNESVINDIISRIENGDTEAMQLVSKAVSSEDEIEVDYPVVLVDSPGISIYKERLRDAIRTSIPAYISENLMNLSKEDLKALGYKEDGTPMKEDLPKIEQVNIGVHTIDGVTKPVLLVKTSSSLSPVILEPDKLSSEYIDKMFYQIAFDQLSPNDPTRIQDPDIFNTVSSIIFDRDIVAPGFTKEKVKEALKQNDIVAPVGSFKDPVSRNHVNIVAVKGLDGRKYLLGSYKDDLADIQKYLSRDGVDLSGYLTTHSVHSIVTIDEQSIDAAIQTTKSEWAKPLVQYQAIYNPNSARIDRSSIPVETIGNLFLNEITNQ